MELTVNTIFLIVVCILAIFIFTLLMRKSFGSLYSLLERLGISVARSNIEKAILCAYYRCEEGLTSSFTEEKCKEIYPNYKLPIAKGELYESDFGKKLIKEYMGEELKVCDALADVYPVEVEVEKEEKVEKSHIDEAINCMCHLKSPSIPESQADALFFTEGFKYYEKVECSTFTDCANSIISTQSQKMYISTFIFEKLYIGVPKFIRTYNVILYPYLVYTKSPYEGIPYDPPVVFSKDKKGNFNLQTNQPQYRVFVETAAGNKIKAFIGKFIFHGEATSTKCGGEAYFDVSLSCEVEERTICAGSSETFCKKYKITWKPGLNFVIEVY